MSVDDRVHERSGSALSRRGFLGKSLGAAVLLLGTDVRFVLGSKIGPVQGDSSTSFGTFYLYGLPVSDSTAAVLESATGSAPGSMTKVADQLATLPIQSPDQATLAVSRFTESQGALALATSFLDIRSGVTKAQGTLDLAGVPGGAAVLVTSVFSADSTTLCLVLSITVPSNWQVLTKTDDTTGTTVSLDGATWETHHAIAYFDGETSKFVGPFEMNDSPSLARVNVAATESDLYLWSMVEPAAIFMTQGRDAVLPPPQLYVFPIGSAIPRLIVPIPSVWPVNEEPTVTLNDGRVVRLLLGTTLEVYSDNGVKDAFTVPQLDVVRAKPSHVTLEIDSNGLLLASAPAIGVATLLDPTDAFESVGTVTYPVPRYAGGSPNSKVALSPNSVDVYVLGDSNAGGIASYDVSTGTRKQQFTNGQHYSGLRLLSNGNIVAVSTEDPRLSFFDGSLKLIGTADSDLEISALYS